MTEALASRTAGLKLGGIVALLLVPMLVLSFFMVRSLQDDLAFTRRELQGVAFAEIIRPVMTGAANGEIAAADLERFRTEGKSLAAALGLDQTYATALAVIFSTGKDKRFALPQLKVLLETASTSSNVILDSVAETYHLGSVATVYAPTLLVDFVDAQLTERGAMRDSTIAPKESARILLTTGKWTQSQQRLASSMVLARNAAAKPAEYEAALEHLDEMSGHPLEISNTLAKAGLSDMPVHLGRMQVFSTGAPHVVEDIANLMSFSASRLTVLLQDRVSAMTSQMGLMLGLSAAACLFGVGAATLLFRSTLRKLDVVEAARSEAERSSEEVRRVSDDVARLNVELADNLNKLREAQDEAVRKGRLSQLGQLTATVAHELRNPLGAVRTSAFLLERRLKGKGLGIEPQLARISNGITRCDNIISQLLDFARVKSMDPETQDFDLWLEKLLNEEVQKLPQSISVNFNPGVGGDAITFDPGRMRRVFVNLISNAAEALVGKGEMQAGTAIANPEITIATRRTSDGIAFDVTDNGPGMTQEVLARVFEPLFTTKNFGTGLGLPAVEKILQEHGGGLEITSTPGQGATFSAWFPQVSALEKSA